jgi:diguanylate cyclase (GGDEF)-like protein
VHAVGVVVFLVVAVAHVGGRQVVDGWLYDALSLAAGGLLLLKAVTLTGDARRACGWLACGLLFSAAGDVTYSLLVSGRATDVPFPTVADPLYLAFYPCALLALHHFIHRTLRTATRVVLLDGLLAALGLGAATAAVVLTPVLDAVDGSTSQLAASLVGAAYPVGTIALVSFSVLAMVVQGWRVPLPQRLIAVAYLLWGIADTGYLLQQSSDSYVEGNLVDLAYPVAGLLLVTAVWLPVRGRARRERGGAAEVVPIVFSLLAVVVLTWDHYQRLTTLAVVLADLCLVAALLRLVMAFRDSQQLASSRQQALTDELTGLPNRRALIEALRAAGPDRVLVLLDLDRFKEINDSLGHRAGDDLLRQLAHRLERGRSTNDLLARLGGDEFALLLRPGLGLSEAVTEMRDLMSRVSQPFRLAGVVLHVDGSAGVALTVGGDDPLLALQHADVAMYAAKRARVTGGSVVAYDPGLDPERLDRLELVEALRAALETGDQLRLAYQPKVRLDTGDLAGVEALVRWQHPDLGLLPPEAFLTIAERSGLMGRLTLNVLDLALRQARTWVDEGLDTVVAVNLSASNLLDVALPSQVADLLTAHGVAAHQLRLEITEEVLMTDHARSLAVVDQLAALGVRVSIDDYGTGYSSLAYLQRLPVDELKLDRSFVTAAAGDARTAAIVESTIALGRRLGMVVVAEGVEDAATAELLRGWGCQLAQGFHYSPPLPAPSLRVWQQAWREHLVASLRS